jgi:hypothetical protein
MAGMSVPSGFFGGSGLSGASTAGFVGGQMNPDTTAAVTNAKGDLTAYDPAKMAMTLSEDAYTPKQPQTQAIAGYDSSGIPSWQSNWLQNGGQGTLKMPEAGVTGDVQTSAKGELFKPPTPIAPIPPPVKKVTTPAKTTTTAPKTTTAAAGPGLTMVPQGNNNSPVLAVNDQWNFQAGTSMPVASAPLGSNGNGGGQAPVFTDGKGNFFFDQAGTKPVPAGAAQQFKMMLQSQGHI